jgi:hypothetical protein
MSITSQEGQRPRADRTRTIPITCRIHGARGFCNLRITRVDDGDMELHVELHPHDGTDACVSVLDETAANALFDVLGEWLG